jgi:hypothetical protein
MTASSKRRLNRRLEMVHTVSVYPATFAIWFHRCIEKRLISHDMDNFTFSILPKQKQNSLKGNQSKDVWQK